MGLTSANLSLLLRRRRGGRGGGARSRIALRGRLSSCGCSVGLLGRLLMVMFRLRRSMGLLGRLGLRLSCVRRRGRRGGALRLLRGRRILLRGRGRGALRLSQN